ncbi:nitrite and sulphite reductase 4Fe-4S domain protein [Clostridium argentinense CDC 2741]|uniref:Nitrite and sulphite reductase 4Fe-4S domain protein n=1 Tax=Clostridium argentinense CDC 2741 TaxID=1418104 RepID=A0A0C1UIT2_9CLOT|nr:nitrite reductase [Clostridium argentinense]ARC85409.1 nitrite reductase [Clostridium argentinense]KIE47210.1 nitrite and sulphite reductase 4Fe-4S domain protein [Clostridium argentinense CDC 2741]NFF41296.1 NAD(P)/FAD-dependent oxidoreductase [Clostridium argentinense]NFP52227.1 NAD(P)/FAD-dependent oxidoreductase [Clostridium argentinense]NFP72023.1 NAD(P)/FAD-dependent oxidoreductase [Clostridium argentinense]
MAHYGNLQKVRDGKRTFAITPHIPGGFISADKLIKIGEVAKKYSGVLKMTSGQRIMITNLKEEDLENIWAELEMEPAVKNIYSVKNVEICPAGFCKRSKANTMNIGMKILNKFHGASMPNRTKIGVAGCRNACGGVYSKDVGVIADVTGFRVTAGGSSGFNPRIADIIAIDITENEAYELVEKILTFYQKTASFGEKISDFIERLGLDNFKEGVYNQDPKEFDYNHENKLV